MAIIKDNAVVLRRLDYSESSQVLAVFTREHGKVRLIAKGIKRATRGRFAPAIDLLDTGHLVFSVRTLRQEALAILTEWTQSEAGAALRDRLDRLLAAQYVAFAVAELTEDWDPHPLLFDGIRQTLTSLTTDTQTLATVTAFQRCLLHEVGSFPILDHCVGCLRPIQARGAIFLSSREGGLLCCDCEGARSEKYAIGRDVLLRMRGEPGTLDAILPAFRAFDYYLSHLMGKPNPISRMLLVAC
ncbi:MAG: DNA repair protein RecO [Planctomycetes bacterium]|nr:DNA repair protein RecO [Planctomycetota bacterium]